MNYCVRFLQMLFSSLFVSFDTAFPDYLLKDFLHIQFILKVKISRQHVSYHTTA